MLATCLTFIMILNGGVCQEPQEILTYDEINRLAIGAGFEDDQLDMVHCIIQKESGGDPRAIGPTEDYGLGQINIGYFEKGFGDFPVIRPDLTREDLLDPGVNVSMMNWIYERSGWGMWSTSEACYEQLAS